MISIKSKLTHNSSFFLPFQDLCRKINPGIVAMEQHRKELCAVAQLPVETVTD